MTDEEIRYLVDHYKPDTQTLEALAGVRLMAIMGPSAVGKTTIMEMAEKKSPLLHMVSNNTSRAVRPGEKQGAEFSFMTKEQMVEGIKHGAFVQVVMNPWGDLYGTRLQDYFLGKVGLLAIISSAIPTFRKLFPDLKIAFIVPSSYEAWMQHFLAREASEEDKTKRLQEASTSIGFALADKGARFVLNDELDKAVDRLIQVAEGAKPDDEDQARQLAAQYLEKLKTQRI